MKTKASNPAQVDLFITDLEEKHGAKIERLADKFRKNKGVADLRDILQAKDIRYSIRFDAALKVIIELAEKSDTLKKNIKRIGEIVSRDFGECDETADTEELNILLGYVDEH